MDDCFRWRIRPVDATGGAEFTVEAPSTTGSAHPLAIHAHAASESARDAPRHRLRRLTRRPPIQPVRDASHRRTRPPLRAVHAAAQAHGRLAIAINNTGILLGGTVDSDALDDFDRMLAVNVRTAFVLAQAAAACMGTGGRIVTVGSIAAQRDIQCKASG